MKKYPLIIIILFVMISCRSGSSEPQEIQVAQSSKVSFQCSANDIAQNILQIDAPNLTSEQEQLLLDNVKFVFEAMIKVGIERLDKIRPELSQKIISKTENKKLTVVCGDIPEYSDESNSLYVGPIIHNILNKTLKNEKYSSSAVNIEEEFQEFLTMFFHEFLHFAEFDNFTSDVHNNLLDLGIPRINDQVYACSCAVFTGLNVCYHEFEYTTVLEGQEAYKNACSKN